MTKTDKDEVNYLSSNTLRSCCWIWLCYVGWQ